MILIIDDDRTIRLSLSVLLKRAGYSSETASSPEEALECFRGNRYSLIIMDMNYSLSTTGEEGLHLLRQAQIFQPDTPVILITAWGSISLAVEGMRAGAFDFLTKPWTNRDLLQRVETALELNGSGTSAGVSDFDRCGIVGSDPKLLDLLATAERVAQTDAPVLILGENGTGKELIANAIHVNSRRRRKPFVMVNLGGISQTLFESEMFGHVKGAYTGALAGRKGRFELADGGTIFLDEIGDLELSCQVKLLRVLQQHTFERLGDSRPMKVDIRVICATNADLGSMVEQRKFREDLFYRINLVTLRVPPLRDRRDDIPVLARHFASGIAREMGCRLPEFSADAMARLTAYDYPGNIRQLKNMIERAMITCEDGRICVKDFDFNESVPQGKGSSGSLDEMERRAVADALRKSEGNLSRAARTLGITRQTLYRRMAKYGLDKEL